MRWPGFRKVRGQVCKRISKRIRELGLKGFAEYAIYLESNEAEWKVLDSYCRITISRFYRDKGVWEFVGNEVLPCLAARFGGELHAWCIGCASGEEPYTLKLVSMPGARPPVKLRVVATDADDRLLERARTACYPKSGIRELPDEALKKAFAEKQNEWHLKEKFRSGVEFINQDIRDETPNSRFHLILCRNLVFTYFDENLQREILGNIVERLHPGGALIIGKHEFLPDEPIKLKDWSRENGIYISSTSSF